MTLLEKYSGSQVRQKSSSPKLLPLAPSLIHAFTPLACLTKTLSGEAASLRPRLEAAIGAHLHRIVGTNLYYWRDGNLEVDFVLTKGRQVYGIEVKSGRRKRADGIVAFSKKYPKAQTIILDWASGGEFLAGPAKLEHIFT